MVLLAAELLVTETDKTIRHSADGRVETAHRKTETVDATQSNSTLNHRHEAANLEPSETATKPKGILKAPEISSEETYGFKERLDLHEDHVMYGSLLKRNKVKLHQDNRLCIKYGLHSNMGCVYENEAFKIPQDCLKPVYSSNRIEDDQAISDGPCLPTFRSKAPSKKRSERKKYRQSGKMITSAQDSATNGKICDNVFFVSLFTVHSST